MKLVISSKPSTCEKLEYLYDKINEKREEVNELYRINNRIDSVTLEKCQEVDLLINEYMDQHYKNKLLSHLRVL